MSLTLYSPLHSPSLTYSVLKIASGVLAFLNFCIIRRLRLIVKLLLFKVQKGALLIKCILISPCSHFLIHILYIVYTL